MTLRGRYLSLPSFFVEFSLFTICGFGAIIRTDVLDKKGVEYEL